MLGLKWGKKHLMKQKLFLTMVVCSGPGGDPLGGDTERRSPRVVGVQGQTRPEPFCSSKTSASRGELSTAGGWTRAEQGWEWQKRCRARRKAAAEGKGWQLVVMVL